MSQPGVHATIYLSLAGKAKWVNVTKLDDYGKWGLILYPDKDSLEKINKLKTGWYEDVEGIKNEIKKDDDGYNVRITRSQQKITRTKTINFTAPLLLKADGETPLQNTLVGNGSDVTCQVEVYFYKPPMKNKQGCAWRLQSIRVDNLIPYEGKRDMTDQDQKLIKTIANVPASF